MPVISLLISKIVQEAFGVKSFFLETVGGTNLEYESGQFLTLIFTLNGKEIRRSYSLGSTRGIDPLPFITIKRIENGSISRYMLDHAYEGMQLSSLEPAGRFYPEAGTERDIVLSAAGSGIVPVFAIAKYILHSESVSVVHLLYGNRSESQTIYLQQLQKLESEFSDRFRITWFFSNSKNIRKARLTWEFLEDYLKNKLEFAPENMCFFSCGPESFMYMTEVIVKALGFKNEQFRKEHFFLHTKQTSSGKTFDKRLHQVEIHTRDKSYVMDVPGDKTILELAKKHKIPVPWSCESGQCSTCALTCIEGEVEMTNNEVLTEKDLKSGLVLTCTAHPKSDLVVLKF